MRKTREALEDLLEAVEAAIKAGDWKVDGACDPTDAIYRAHKALAAEKTADQLTDLQLFGVTFSQNGKRLDRNEILKG